MSNAGIIKERGDTVATGTMTDNAVIRGDGDKRIQDSGVTLDDSDNMSGVNTLSVIDAATTRTNLGLGSMSTQAANSVAITGGSITGITDIAVADGGTGASTAANARTNLGLGTIAVQNTPLTTSVGGTGLTTMTPAGAVLCAGVTQIAPVQVVESAGTTGQVLTSNGAGALPTFQAAAGGGVTWHTPTSPTGNQMISGHGYIASITDEYYVYLTLPTTAAVGEFIYLVSIPNGWSSWSVIQNAGQSIRGWTGESWSTTVGVTGTLSPGDRVDAMLVCIIANTTWKVFGYASMDLLIPT